MKYADTHLIWSTGIPTLNFEKTVYGVFRRTLFKHRHEADQQTSPPESPPQNLTILEGKTTRTWKKLQPWQWYLLVEQWVSFQERGDVWVMESWLTAWRVWKCSLWGIFSGVTPAVVYKQRIAINDVLRHALDIPIYLYRLQVYFEKLVHVIHVIWVKTYK